MPPQLTRVRRPTLLWRHQYGFTPLMYASMSGSTECIAALLAAGADLEAKNMVRGRVAWCHCMCMAYGICVPHSALLLQAVAVWPC